MLIVLVRKGKLVRSKPFNKLMALRRFLMLFSMHLKLSASNDILFT